MSSLSLLELIKLKDTYKILNLSITEVMMQIYKIVSFPIYLSLMTILSAIIMFNTKNFKSNTLKISIGLFFSVIIYYINNFFNVLGKTEKMPIILSISITMIILTIICSIYCLKINEK
jgi:lipopolysaccharide export system permease protein